MLWPGDVIVGESWGWGWPPSLWSLGSWKWGTSSLMLGIAIGSASSLTPGTGSLSSDYIRNKKKYMKKAYLPVVTHFTARARGLPLSSSSGETAGDH